MASTLDNLDAEAEEEALEVQSHLESAMMIVATSKRKKKKIDPRTLPRNPRKKYRHEEALHCIQRDYLGIPGDPNTPIFDGRRISTLL